MRTRAGNKMASRSRPQKPTCRDCSVIIESYQKRVNLKTLWEGKQCICEESKAAGGPGVQLSSLYYIILFN